MRIAILAGLPVHILPGCEALRPRAHFATWLPQLVTAFAAQTEHEIHWIFISRELNHPEPIRWQGQTFHCLYVLGRFKFLRGYRADCRAIQRCLEEIQPDLVHAWGTEDCYGLAAALSGYPWLLSMQGILQEYVRLADVHPFVRVLALYEKFVVRRAQEITVESKWGESVMRRYAPHARLHLVEYGVQEDFFRVGWEPDPERPVALFIGTLDSRKGIQDAVRAFADPSLAGAELHLIGGPEPRFARRLHAASTSNVRWLGRLSREETAQALSRAWCLVHPTRADTSPNVVKEARVIGMPVVTTPAGGQSDYIFDGENGFLVQPGDVPALTERLRLLLTDLTRARAMGARHVDEQRAFFRPEETAKRFLAIYSELAGPASAPRA